MELLVQAGIAIFWVCVVVFIIGLVQLIASKGKSKMALRMVIAPIIIVVAMLIIGFGTCVLMIMK